MDSHEIKFQSAQAGKAYLAFVPRKKDDFSLAKTGEIVKNAVRDACASRRVEIIFGKLTADYLYLIISYPLDSGKSFREEAVRLKNESGARIAAGIWSGRAGEAGENFWEEDFLLIPTGGGAPRDIIGVIEDFAEHIQLAKKNMPLKNSTKCLITGGAGFIGSSLADALIKKGCEAVIIDNLSSGKKEYVNPKANFFELDIRSPEIARVFADESFDYVFHLAAQIEVAVSVQKPEFDNAVNVLGGLNILENCRRHNVKKILFASTGGAIYGDAEVIPTPETYVPEPISPYGIHKLTFEKYLNYYHKVYQLDYAVLRLANVYGPRQYKGGEAGVVSIFIDNMVNLRESVIFGTGRQTRDYVYVGDVVEAFLSAMDGGAAGVFNIGTGIESNLLELAEAIEAALGRPFAKRHGPAKPGEQARSCLDIRRAAEILGWKPKTALKEGIQKTIDWSKLKRLIQSEK